MFARAAYWRLLLPHLVRRRGVVLRGPLRLYGTPIIGLHPGSEIILGARTVLCSASEFTALGVNHPVVLRTMRAAARIIIGDDCGISGGSICAARSIVLGSNVLLGANVTIVDTDFHAIAPHDRRYNTNEAEIAAAPVTIEDNVFIGTGSYVLKGVTIGANTVVGAASVVTKSLPANVIAAGNPARVLRSL